MMRRPTDIQQRSAAVERLAQLGAAATPDVRDMLEPHMAAVRDERLVARRSVVGSPRRKAFGRRHAFVVATMAAVVALPSLAFAGALPDQMQQAASRVAKTVGVEIPTPDRVRDDVASSDERVRDAGVVGSRPVGGRGSETGPRPQAPKPKPNQDWAGGMRSERGSDARPTTVEPPGRLQDGEQRGNRFGQVEAGPDRATPGMAVDAPQERPATAGRPAETPKAVLPASATGGGAGKGRPPRG